MPQNIQEVLTATPNLFFDTPLAPPDFSAIFNGNVAPLVMKFDVSDLNLTDEQFLQRVAFAFGFAQRITRKNDGIYGKRCSLGLAD